MTTTLRSGAAILLMVLSTACGLPQHHGYQAFLGGPSPVPAPTPTQSPAPAPTSFPPLSGPARVFGFDHQLSRPVTDYTKNSRYVLYDNGAFALQSLNASDYHTGTLDGKSLTIQYNDVMILNDFEDAVYVLMP
jgi:hypothetical protein